MQRSSAFWSRHPPTEPPLGVDTTSVPFQVSGRKPRFHDASLYDSILLAATAIDACLKNGCHPVGHGYEGVMPYFREASIDGVAGRTSTKTGSNDPQVCESSRACGELLGLQCSCSVLYGSVCCCKNPVL